MMERMATWEDGPEFAPVERPDGFATPRVEPLEAPPQPPHPSDGAPPQRPGFAGPTEPAPPLASIVPAVENPRDPTQAFDVATMTMTAESAWGAVHSAPVGMGAPTAVTETPHAFDPTAPIVSTNVSTLPGSVNFPPPSPDSLASPMPPGPLGPPGPPAPPGPAGLPVPSAPGQAPYPAPGTPAWFGPTAPAPRQPVAPPGRVPASLVMEAVTPGVLFPLLIGGFIFYVAPVMLVIAGLFSRRVSVRSRYVRTTFAITGGFVALVALVSLFGEGLTFETWWRNLATASVLMCWASLLAVVVIVQTGLTRGERPVRRP